MRMLFKKSNLSEARPAASTLYPLSPEQCAMVRQSIEKTAIQNFLSHPNIKNSNFWKKQSADLIKIEQILNHAKGNYSTHRAAWFIWSC